MFAHAGHWIEIVMFAPAFLLVGIAIARSLAGRHRPTRSQEIRRP